ncbi:hypothetical protein A4R29_22475 [Mesorhizobium ciceri biovar biserrulae]|nr:hypothetical protein A4R29_22475 [Mesorhizobium ciceri biovar biserrulae]
MISLVLPELLRSTLTVRFPAIRLGITHHEGQTKKSKREKPGPSLVSPASKLAGQKSGHADDGDDET